MQARAALLLRRKQQQQQQHVGEGEGEGKAGREQVEAGVEEGEEEEEEVAEAEPWTLPSLPDITCCPVEALPSLDPASHVYSFWEGVPPAARRAFGALVARSSTVRGVAVVQRAMRSRGGGGDGGGGGGGGGGDGDDDEEEGGPGGPSSSSCSSVPEAVMRDYGFGRLELRESFAVSMSGSGRSFRAYVFSRGPRSDRDGAGPRPPRCPLAAPSGASEQTAAAAVAAASESPESKPPRAPPSSAFARPLPRACPMLAEAD